LEVVCGEPDDAGVDRDLDDGVAGEVVAPAVVRRGLWPGAGSSGRRRCRRRGPGAGAQGGRGVSLMAASMSCHWWSQLVEMAALRAEDLRQLADVELAGVGAGGGAGPEPVAAVGG
jgi:hypothetical protein